MNDEINKNLICKINKELSSFADNKKIFYTEIMLSDKDGNIPASVSDGLHLKNNGYRIITDHLLSEFKNILTSGKTEDNDKKRREKTWVIF
jgi:lysophospholipase L1-like esterase